MEDERDEINIIHDEGEDISDQGPKMIPNTELTPKERRWVILGALSGALLIGLAFIVGLGIIIALMVIFWT
ncbi:hypothetical protein HNP82_000145 [Catenibacillus scindens]|uniref:Uncharacterized protein n=1 Tax=Catenibacillus scindens TaxID=673271 RepID=A0A7W8M492_9FIRM|nr:hypothetical protein [Catenibacillus scindens]MBB5263051.1 hypothetical protein [Catenibacillus scindens]